MFLFDWVERHRKGISAVIAATVLCCAAGLGGLTITPDNRIFYGPSNPYFLDFKQFEQDYTSNNNILIVLTAPFPIYESNYPEAIRWLTDQMWGISNVMRVDSLATYPHALSQQNIVEVKSILDTACPPSEACIPAASELLMKPELVNRLVSSDHRSTGILATLYLDIGTVGEIEAINQRTESLVEQFSSKFPEYDAVFTGGIPMMGAFAKASSEDLAILLPIVIAVMALVLYIFLGSIRPTAILFFLGGSAAISVLGVAGWLDLTINNATSIVPVIVLTLVIASAMHVMLHFQRSAGDTHDTTTITTAARAAFESNIPPLTISAATSIAGLLSLSLVDSPPLQELGQLSALGVLFGYLLTITALPLALSSQKRGFSSQAASSVQQFLNAYARSIEGHNTYFAVSVGIAALLLLGNLRIDIDDNFVNYFDESTEFRQYTDLATERLSGPNHIEVLVRAPGNAGVFEPAHLSFVESLSGYIRESTHVANVHSYSDIIESVISIFDNGGSKETLTADEIAQLFLVYELSLEHGQSNTDFVNRAQSESRISVLLKETSSSDIQKLELAIYRKAQSLDPEFPVTVTGENIPVAHLSEMNIRSMVYGLGGSILFTAVLTGLVFRKARLAITAFLAVLVPVACGFGVWGWLNGEIGLASTAIVALTIGIVVDDAVHLIYRYLDGSRRMALDEWQAAAYSVHRAGSAVAITSAVLISGLALLQLSSFEVNSSFGVCTCLIIALALSFDLLVLPRILVWTGR